MIHPVGLLQVQPGQGVASWDDRQDSLVFSANPFTLYVLVLAIKPSNPPLRMLVCTSCSRSSLTASLYSLAGGP